MKKDGMRQALLYLRDCFMQFEHSGTCRGGRGGRELPYPPKAICNMATSLKNQLAKHSTDNLPSLLIYKKKILLIIYIEFIEICVGPVSIMEQLFLFVFRLALLGNSVY